MKILFFGGSSEIAVKLAKKIKNVDSASRSSNINYKKNYIIKNYNKNNLTKVFKKIKKKYDIILIFNGIYSFSTLSNFDEKDFDKTFNLNFKIPILIAREIVNYKILQNNGSIFFISSIAAEQKHSGNAYYSIAKNSLNFASKILAEEQKNRGLRINVLSLGLVNNKMGKLAKNVSIKKNSLNFYKNETFLKKIVTIIKNKKINSKKIIIT